MNSQCCHSNCMGHNFAVLLGRIFIGVLFLAAAFGKITNWSSTVEYVAAHKLMLPEVVLGFGTLLEILGGLSLILGLKVRWGAFFLILVLVPATLIFHAFWNFSGDESQEAMQHFLSNLGLIGGLLVVVAFGGGKYSFDARCCHHHVCATSEHDCCHKEEEKKD